MTTVNAQIAANNRDGFDYGTSFNSNDSGDLWMGYYYTNQDALLAWQLPIDQGTIITSALLQVYVNDNSAGSSRAMVVQGNDTDNTSVWSSSYHGPQFVPTTASLAFDLFDGPSGGWWTIGDIVDILQEVLDRPGWSNNNYFGVRLKTNNTTNGDLAISSIEGDSDLAAKLVVTFSSGITITITAAGLTLAGQTVTPTPGTLPDIEVDINAAALMLSGQTLTPAVGVGIDVNPASLTLASQVITPSAGIPPDIEIEISSAAMTLAGQNILPVTGIDVPINAAALLLAGQFILPTAGIDIPVSPASLQLAGQNLTVTAGTPPDVEISLNPANLTLIGQNLTPAVGVSVDINPAAVTLAGQSILPEAGVEVVISPAAMTLAGQTITPTPGGYPISIEIVPAAMTLAGQVVTPTAGDAPVSVTISPATLLQTAQPFTPTVPGLDPVDVLINPAHTYVNGQPFTIEITGPGVLIGESNPQSLTVATTNTISQDAGHTHEIVASYDPGAASAILKSAPDGSLSLTNLYLSGDLQVNGGDITSSGNMAISPSGTLALNAPLNSSLIPSLTDTYSLGSEFKLWRNAWISEIQAVLLVENTTSAIGGRFLIPHGQGTLGDDVDDTQTQIDFGISMTAGDTVVMRGLSDAGLPKVEYITIGTVVSGTLYNVTRNVDGSGANAWPEGHVFIVYGAEGDGRIELDAQTAAPRISVIEQGAAYNLSTERVRIGELTGWKSGVSGYGIAIGDPAGDHFYYTPDDGIVIAADGSGMTNIDGGNIQADSITAAQINVSSLSALSADLGTVTAGSISGVSASFGGGDVTLNSDGIFIKPSYEGSWYANPKNRVNFRSSDTDWYGYITGMMDMGNNRSVEISSLTPDGTTKGARINVFTGYISFYGNTGVTGGDFSAGNNATVGKGLYVGSNATPDDNDIHYDGNLKSEKSAVTYDVYGINPQVYRITASGWWGTAKTTTNNGAIPISTWSIPSAATGIHLFIATTTGSAGNAAGFGSTSGANCVEAVKAVTNQYASGYGYIPVNNGNIYFTTNGNCTLYVSIHGYTI